MAVKAMPNRTPGGGRKQVNLRAVAGGATASSLEALNASETTGFLEVRLAGTASGDLHCPHTCDCAAAMCCGFK